MGTNNSKNGSPEKKQQRREEAAVGDRLAPPRQRQRHDPNVSSAIPESVDESGDTATCSTNRPSTALQRLILALCWCPNGPKGVMGERIGKCVMEGGEVEARYGCHAHLYDTVSPDESHGTALIWSLSRSSLNALSLLTLCRVGNSTRKKVILVDEKEHIGVVLHYTNEL